MSINHCGSYWILYNAMNVVSDNDCNCNDNGNDNGINNHNYIGKVNKDISNNDDYNNNKKNYRTALIIMITIIL